MAYLGQNTRPGQNGGLMRDYNWYVIHIRSKCERSVTEALQSKGVETFLPSYRTRRRWSDRVKEIELPLFAGYAFCKCDPFRRLPILTTPGVISILGSGSGPTPVEDSEIAAIQAIVSSGL